MYVTQNVEPSPSSMKEIIQCAGGQVSFLYCTKSQVSATSPFACPFSVKKKCSHSVPDKRGVSGQKPKKDGHLT